MNGEFNKMERLALPERVETERLTLTRLRYEEAEEIFYSYASKPEVTRFLAFPTHTSVGDARSFVKYAVPAWDAGKEYVYAIRLRNSARFIGTFGIINDHGKVHFGYAFSPTQWGNGYATEACKRMLEIMKQASTIYCIWTFVDEENVASTRVLQKCGLRKQATMENWFRFVNQNNQAKTCYIFQATELPVFQEQE